MKDRNRARKFHRSPHNSTPFHPVVAACSRGVGSRRPQWRVPSGRVVFIMVSGALGGFRVRNNAVPGPLPRTHSITIWRDTRAAGQIEHYEDDRPRTRERVFIGGHRRVQNYFQRGTLPLKKCVFSCDNANVT